MGYYLLDHPNGSYKQYRETRRGNTPPSGTIVVHTAENYPDTEMPDHGAEGVASWITRRTDPGSYHRLCDADSIIRMAPWEMETWHCRYTNRWSVGISGATQAALWPKLGATYRTRMTQNMAMAAADAVSFFRARKIYVPLRWISRDEALAQKPGFIRHGSTDPSRRSDPGAAFPGEMFLELIKSYTGQPTRPTGPSRRNFLPLHVDGDEGHKTITEEERALKKTGDYAGLIEEDYGRPAVRGPVLKVAEQRYLKRKGYYRGLLDGDFGMMSTKAEQHFLADEKLYPYQWIDGDRGIETIKSLQTALNFNRIR